MTASTTPTIDTDRVEAAARALLDSRITAVRTLAEARRSRHDHRAALLEAEGRDAAAYAAALRAGWTTELNRVGLDTPSTRTPERPRTTTTKTQGQGQGRGATDGRSAAAAPSHGRGSSSAASPAG